MGGSRPAVLWGAAGALTPGTVRHMLRPDPAPADPAALDALAAWLHGRGPRPGSPGKRLGASVARRWLDLMRRHPVAPPHDGPVVVAGLAPWRHPSLSRWLRGGPDRVGIAVMDAPLAWDWPEYDAPAAVAADTAAIAVLKQHAGAVVVPDAAARTLAETHLGPGAPRVLVAEKPSRLAGTGPDARRGHRRDSLAGADYLVACGPIESRSNALLLLQLWRDALAAGTPLPRLVLAGARGAQTEEIAPFLDWNQDLRTHVAEAPNLSDQDVRTLVENARALLVPDFARPDAALLRDARLLGVPTLAADTPEAAALDVPGRLSAIDGLGWRDALHALPPRQPAPSAPLAPLLDWAGYAARLSGLAAEVAADQKSEARPFTSQSP